MSDSEQQINAEQAPAPVKKKKAGFGFALASFILSIFALMESAFPVAYKVMLSLEEGYLRNKHSGRMLIFDTTLSDLIAKGFTYAVYACGVLAIGFGIGGMIAYLVSKNKKGNTITLVFSIIGIIFGISAILAISLMSTVAANLNL